MTLLVSAVCSPLWAQMPPSDPETSTCEQWPLFRGCVPDLEARERLNDCTQKAVAQFFGENLQYPDTARRDRVEGTVILRFTIDATGKVTEPEILRDIGHRCGEEALRVAGLMPVWQPALDRNLPVALRITLPVRFDLSTYDDRTKRKSFRVVWGNAVSGTLTGEELVPLAGQEVSVRDLFGQAFVAEGLTLRYETGRRTVERAIKGNKLDKPAQRLLRRARPGTLLTVTAIFQDGTGRVSVWRQWEVVD